VVVWDWNEKKILQVVETDAAAEWLAARPAIWAATQRRSAARCGTDQDRDGTARVQVIALPERDSGRHAGEL
jgi:hypothetical protein